MTYYALAGDRFPVHIDAEGDWIAWLHFKADSTGEWQKIGPSQVVDGQAMFDAPGETGVFDIVFESTDRMRLTHYDSGVVLVDIED